MIHVIYEMIMGFSDMNLLLSDMKSALSDMKLVSSDIKSGLSDMKFVLFSHKRTMYDDGWNFVWEHTYLSAGVILGIVTVVDSECSSSHLLVLGFHAGR